MKHITWLLLVLTLATGCGRDKKAWAQKIDRLVQRAYACKDVACAKQVDKEMRDIVGSDTEGRNLDEGEPELMFSSAKRIQNRLADLEFEEKLVAERKTSLLTPLEVFEASVSACELAYIDLRAPARAKVEATLAKVGATLPPDVAPGAKNPGGLFWYDEFSKTFGAAMREKVPVNDSLYRKLVGEICVVLFRYEGDKAKEDATRFKPTVDSLGEVSEALGHYELTKDLVDAVRKAAPDKDVMALGKSTLQSLRAEVTKYSK